ncbi:hypothetical protein EYF80_051191 [Liparis tanakae]|uniref:Uncharacterized protein n=1 Tax=Liparis tanakae TaxID=230148 RepID=A0A4Z2FBV3_9TELE|nr:hypothetical protein EYF80_051191 [Liparis tanakae]
MTDTGAAPRGEARLEPENGALRGERTSRRAGEPVNVRRRKRRRKMKKTVRIRNQTTTGSAVRHGTRIN